MSITDLCTMFLVAYLSYIIYLIFIKGDRDD